MDQWIVPLVTWVSPIAALQAGPDWTTLGGIFVALLTLCGVIYSTARSRASSREANALNEAKTAWEEMRKMRAEHTADREQHKKDRKQWEREREEDRLEREKEREEDRVEREQDRREREELRDKVDTTARLFTLSVGYIEKIIRHIRSGGGEPLPTVPEDLRSYLAHLFEPVKER